TLSVTAMISPTPLPIWNDMILLTRPRKWIIINFSMQSLLYLSDFSNFWVMSTACVTNNAIGGVILMLVYMSLWFPCYIKFLLSGLTGLYVVMEWRVMCWV